MSKLVNRIFKSKKSSKTLEDLKDSSPNGNGTSHQQQQQQVPRSKSVHMNNGMQNGTSTANGIDANHHHQNGKVEIVSPRPVESSAKKSTMKKSSTPISPFGDRALTPMEIPLEEQLQMIAEDPPHVARSTPKGYVPDTSRWKEEHDMKDCLYERAVYEKMIDNSLKTCELLQNHLDSYITVVRKTPSRETTPVVVQQQAAENGHK